MKISAIINSLQGISNPVLPVEDVNFYTNIGTGPNNDIAGLTRQSDGKVLVCGYFTTYSGNNRGRLIRLNSDGTEDTAFASALGTGFDNSVYMTKVQADGKILVAGEFDNLNGTPRAKFVRLNSDGTVDTTFYTNLGTSFNTGTGSIGIQPDGKIIVGGAFTTFNGNTRNRIVRLNTNGTEDSSFYSTLGTGVGNGSVNNINIQSDSKIVVTGQFALLNGVARNGIFRLNPDGSVDSAYNTNTGTAVGYAINNSILQSDNKVILIGFFNSFNGTTVNKICRLNTDGTLDNTFLTNTGTGFSQIQVNIAPYAISFLSTGQIVVGGVFTLFNGVTVGGYVKLSTDGVLDTTYNTLIDTGFTGGGVFATAVESDDKVIAAGAFNAFQGNARNRIIKLNDI